jgi:hypothetical protein
MKGAQCRSESEWRQSADQSLNSGQRAKSESAQWLLRSDQNAWLGIVKSKFHGVKC